MRTTEKKLIYFDQQAAKKEIEGRKALIEAITELKSAFDDLDLGLFSKEIFIELVNSGTDSLKELVRRQCYEELKGIKIRQILLGQLVSGMDFRTLFEPLQKPLAKIKRLINDHDVDHYGIEFNGPNPVLTETMMEAIREDFRYYTEGPEEEKLYDLLQRFCKASNDLEQFVVGHNAPGIIDDLLTAHDFYFDFTGEGKEGILTPRPSIINVFGKMIARNR